LMLAGYMGYSAHEARLDPQRIAEELEEIESQSLASQPKAVAIGFIIGGLAGLIVGADLLVTGAVNIARDLGVSEAAIGLTMIALGTSLPELATSIAAAIRQNCDVAIGNVIGSNMFNILGVIGITSLVAPIPVTEDFIDVNLWVMLGAALLLIPFCMFRIPISRIYGIGFTAAYLIYIAYVF